MILGITGPAGAGKDTAGDMFVREYKYMRQSFAGPLKEMLASVGLREPADRNMKEVLIPGFPFTWRRAAQTLGTDWGRELDNDIWVKLATRSLERGDCVVFTDVRFENEAKAIRDLGGYILHITGRKADLGEAAGHASEKGISCNPLSDIRVDNSGEIYEFHAALRSTAGILGVKHAGT